MKFLFGVVACFLCVNLTLSVKNTFKAAVVLKKEVEVANYVKHINEAAKLNVDVLVLPSPEEELKAKGISYDEAVKTLANAAKQNSLYVVAHLLDKIRCQRVDVVVRNNLVFGRDGAVVSSYRKPVHNLPNCTTSDPGLQTFTTDFGVTFGLLMEEDLVLQNVEMMKGLKNFVVVGDFVSDIPFLGASRFSPSWAYVTDANLISSSGIYSGRAGNVGVSFSTNDLVEAELNRNGRTENKMTPPIVNPSNVLTFPGEDLSQYIIRPLNLETSARGHRETVCLEGFCCEFDVKTRFVGPHYNDLSYGLAVFNGVRHLGAAHNIGAQTCAVVACAGLFKRSCSIGSSNDTNVQFDKLSISANFTTSGSAQFPIIVSGEVSKFTFDSQTVKNVKKITSLLNMNMNIGTTPSKSVTTDPDKPDKPGGAVFVRRHALGWERMTDQPQPVDHNKRAADYESIGIFNLISRKMCR